ncbi:MAG: glycine-rich protein, partial [Deltaproteobacteria bacterium]|nr:glycine-rich protein [Deltaproteobacteria bacterium]
MTRLLLAIGVWLVPAAARAAAPCGANGVYQETVTSTRHTWEGDTVVPLAQCVYTKVGLDTFTVPPYQTEVMFAAYGAGDGYRTDNTAFGRTGDPGSVEGRLAVGSGETFDIRVGGLPTGSSGRISGVCDVGGYNGGGNSGSTLNACGGGGASDVRPSGGGLADRLFVGGGAGGNA